MSIPHFLRAVSFEKPPFLLCLSCGLSDWGGRGSVLRQLGIPAPPPLIGLGTVYKLSVPTARRHGGKAGFGGKRNSSTRRETPPWLGKSRM